MNPYKIEPPFVISFSGGRTSGYMLRKILDAYDGVLPADGYVIFANTGKEHFKTLDFVYQIETEWTKIIWIEYRHRPQNFEIVSYETASRNGRPFEERITDNAPPYGKGKPFLPNPVMRICTTDLKVVPIKKYMKSIGVEEFCTVLGLRADEPRRVSKVKQDPTRDIAVPLFEAKADEKTLGEFWAQNNFDLELPNNDKAFGNCDLCFLKSQARIERVIEHDPKLANWWIDMEKLANGTFHKDRASYKDLLVQVTMQGKLFQDQIDDSRPCDCTE